MWFFFGFFLFCLAILDKYIINLFKKIPKLIKIVFTVLVCFFIISFIIIESIIISNIKDNHVENADYIIILGAKVDGMIPSLSLRSRINTAFHYLEGNENTKVIVTGGRGKGELISEAEAMVRILTRNGIDSERILVENNSTSTKENLQYSIKYIDSLNDSVVIITSEFHLYRAKKIAQKIGYMNITGITSKSPTILLPTYFMREYFAVVYNKMVGNM
jgi:uncharacterized SAM-binding protein YcdF (DUF218 family)